MPLSCRFIAQWLELAGRQSAWRIVASKGAWATKRSAHPAPAPAQAGCQELACELPLRRQAA